MNAVEALPAPILAAPVACAHCGEPVARADRTEAFQFCCAGCESVFSILRECGLDEYYARRTEAGEKGTRPRKSARREHLESLRSFRETLIFYESPHRIQASLEDIQDILGNRDSCIGRELTKLHEEYLFGKLSEVRGRIKEIGEFVIVIDGFSGTEALPERKLTREVVLKTLGISRNELYDLFFKNK